MAKPNIDFGRMTQEETIEVMREAMDYLNYQHVVEAIKEKFEDDIEEIVAQLEP